MSAHTPVRPLIPDVRVERSAMRKWTVLIVGLLLLQVVFGGVTVALAMRGRGTVEQDYYNKALHWDDHEAMVQASARLGWKADITVGSAVTSQGQRALILKLTDKDGAPVEHAQVQVAFFHRAHPMDLRQAELKATGAEGGGTYAGSVPLDQAGIWEFRLTVHRPAATGTTPEKAGADEMFIATLQRDLLE